MSERKKVVGYIDMTPTWKGLLPLLIAGIEDGTPAARQAAIQELARMAEAADRYNESVKETEECDTK